MDLSGKPAGDYDYTLTFTRPDGTVLGTATGMIRRAPEPALKAGSGTVVAWTAPQDAWPGLNVRQVFETSPRAQNTWTDKTALFAYNAADGTYEIDLSALEPMVFDYRVTFTNADTGEALGQASGTLLSLPPPQTGSVEGFDMPATTLSWMAPPAGLHATVKLAQSSSASPDFAGLPAYSGAIADFNNPLAANPHEANRQGLSLAQLPPGEYAYQVEYLADADNQSFGKLQGRFATAPAAELTNVPRGVTFAQDTPLLHWLSPTVDQPLAVKLVVQGPQGEVELPDPVDFTFEGQRLTAVNFSGLGTGAYSYALSFTNEATGLALQSTGNFHHLADATVQDGVLSWDAPPAGSTAVLRWRNFDPARTAPYTGELRSFTSLPSGRQGVNLNSLPSPADVDYRVEFLDAAGLTLAATEGELRLLPQLAMGALGASVLSWETPPAGITQQISFRLASAGPDAPFSTPILDGDIPRLDGAHSGFNLKNAAAGDYEFRLLMQRDGQEWGTTTGTVRVLPQASFGNDGESVLSWTDPSSGIATTLQVWRDGIEVAVAPVSRGGGRSGVDFADRSAYPVGNYTYRLAFTQDGQAFGATEGSFTIAVPPTVALDTPNVLLGSLGRYFSWTAPAAGSTQVFTYKNLDAAGIEGTLSGSQIPALGDGLSGFDISNLPAGRYVYTLATTPAGGTEVVEEGEFTVVPNPSVTATPVPLPGGDDPYYDKVSLLVPFEGENNGTVFRDFSQYQQTARSSSSTSLTTDVSLFGESSVNMGSGLGWAHPSLLMTGDFSVELGLRLDSAPTGNLYFATFAETEGPDRVTFFTDSTGRILMNKYGFNSQVIGGNLTFGQFNRIGIFRSGTTVYAMIDGTLVGTASLSGTVGNGTGGFSMGPHGGVTPSGYVDELRVTKGVARHTTSYTPATRSFASLPDNYDPGNAGVLSWPVGAGGQTATLYYNNQPLPATLENGVYSVNLSGLPLGNYNFKIVYSDENGDYAQVDSTVSLVATGEAVGTENNKAVFANPLTISKATDAGGNPTTRITFNTGDATMMFRYQDATGWHSLPVSTARQYNWRGNPDQTVWYNDGYEAFAAYDASLPPDRYTSINIKWNEGTYAWGGSHVGDINTVWFDIRDEFWHYVAQTDAYIRLDSRTGFGTVDIGQLPSGTYAYELVAVTGGDSYAHSTGTFSLSHAGEVFKLPVGGIPGVYANSAGQIRWPVPGHAVEQVIFGAKVAGSEQWIANILPRQEGSEFVVDAWGLGVGSYDIAIVYTGVNPVTGDQVWTDDALGRLTITEQQITYVSYGPTSSAFTELIGAHNNPAGPWQFGWKAGHGATFNLFDARYPGLTDFFVPSWSNTSVYYTPYAGADLGAGSMTAHPGSTNEVAVARWRAPSAGTWDVDVTFIRGGSTTRRLYLV